VLTERAILTALPAGADRDAGVARVTCFVTLRASGDGETLAETDRLVRWPEVLGPTLESIRVEVDTVGPVDARVVSAAPDPDLWAAVFPPTTSVHPHEPERWTHRPVATFGARTVHDATVAAFAAAAAASPSTPPTAIDLLGALDDASNAWANLMELPAASQLLGDGPLDTAQRARNAGTFSEPWRDRLEGVVAGRLAEASAQAAVRRAAETGVRLSVNGDYLPASSPGGANQAQIELARFLVFHHQPEGPPTPLPDEAQLARDLDFHRIQTALGAYRHLLRRLGLAVDLEIPLDAVQVDPGRIRIVASPDLPDPRTPWTAYALAGPTGEPVFWPRPRPDPVGQRVANGMLDLTFRERYGLAQVDVDSAAFKTLNAALAATAHAVLPRAVGTPDADAPPSLRSTGLAILHDGRAEALHANVASGHNLLIDLESPDPPTLFAEDVTRGYRIDIRERRDTEWRSLHARRGHYVGVGAAAGAIDEVVDDEGWVGLALAERPQPPDAAPTPDAPVYLHESIARWEGWSLAAPRPGLGLPRSPHAPTDGEPDTQPVPDASAALPDGVGLEVTFHAQPGTLPKLRVGAEYRVRARAVDLAGNGPTIGDADAVLDAFEQAGTLSPVLPAGSRPFPFERFDPLLAPALAMRRAVTEGESIAHVVIRSDHDVSAADYAAATGYGADAERHIAPAKASLQDAELLGRFDVAIGSADAAAEDSAYDVATRESGRLADDLIHPEGQLELPYLPDPWSAGVVLVGLPGLPVGTVTRFDEDGTAVQVPDRLPGLRPQPGVLILDWATPAQQWWLARPLRLRAVEGADPPSWDPAARVLTVGLPKAARVDVLVSSLPDERHLDEHGAWHALLSMLAAPDVAGTTELARTGRVWAVSPARALRLVHAIQHPLNAPDVLALRASRYAGETATTLSGEVRVHGASTGRLDIDAEWEEWVDLPGAPEPAPPQRVQRTAAALTTEIHLARDTDPQPPGVQRAASARYVEADDLVLLGTSIATSSEPAFTSAHELHDTRHRSVGYRVVASSRFGEYFRREFVDPPGAQTRESARLRVDVPSSAPPPPPRLLYAMPMFGWEREVTDRTQTSRRRGGGLRLFLGRPWYASGDGELLGVVLWPSPDCPLPGRLEPLVTRMGFDPIWPLPAAPSPPVTPSPDQFRRAVAVGEGIPLFESPNDRVSVVGHEVEFDAGRDLWTCDLEMELGDAYTPFVRLALVRYQPSSLAGAHLSSVAVAQIAQVTPERTVTLVAASDDPRTLSLVLTGAIHGAAWQTGALPFPYGSEVEVYVEERIDAIADDELGWKRIADVAVTTDHGPGPIGSYVRWSGRITLPDGHVTGRHRVVVVERERLADDRAAFWMRPVAASPTTTRIVFAEHFVV
jgi:hypothetical protein